MPDARADQEKILRMGSAPIGRLLLEFGIPAVVSVVCNALYNIIDSIFLGHAMGEIGLAATTVASPIMTIMMALAVIAGAGGNSLAAILLGEDKHDRAEQTLGNTMFLMIVLAIPVALIATFCLDPILRLVGATDVTLPYARLFMQIISYGFLFNNISFGISNFLRTAGEPNIALGVSVLSTAVCILFNYVFVILWGWGVGGSALATVLGQGVASLWVLWYFIFSKTAPFKLRARYLRPDWKLCGRICTLGMAPCALQAAAAITQVVANTMIATLGAADPIGTDGALASIGVVLKVVMFTVFPVSGVAIAAQPIWGFNTGARKFDRVKRCLFDALMAGFVILVAFFVVIHLFPTGVIGLFGVQGDLMDFSVDALKVMTALIPLVGIQMIGSNYFQATGQAMKSTILSLTRQLIFLLPMYLLAPWLIPTLFPQVSPLFGFCFAFPMADFLSVVFCGIFLIVEVRRLNRLIAQQEGGRPIHV
ncbi:MAG: MATE family efflux transporter [Coriobacteriales bacterium]